MTSDIEPAPTGEPVTPADEEPAAVEPSPVGFWCYTGAEQRVYAHIPVTVDNGDVIAWVGPPARDGRWVEDPGPATLDPDNTPTAEE